MKSIKHLIILELLKTDSIITYQQIAEKLAISNKTVRNYIDDVEKFLKNYNIELIRQVGQGVYLVGNKSQINQAYLNCQKQLEESKLFSSEIRENVIIYYLLSMNKKITVSFLEKTLFITRPSIYQDLKKIELYFAQFDIKIIKNRKNGIYLQAGEKRFRKCFVDYATRLSHDSNKNYLQFPLLYDFMGYLYNDEANHNRTILTKYIEQLANYAHLYLSTENIELLINYILITIIRIKENRFVTLNPIILEKIKNKKIVEYIYLNKNFFTNMFQIDLSTSEISYIASHISTIGFNKSLDYYQNTVIIEKIFNQFSPIIMEKIKLHNYDNLNNNIKLFIYQIIEKTHFEMDFYYSQTSLINEKYTYYYQIAQNLNHIFKEQLNIDLAKDVIAHLTMIILAAIEQDQKKLIIYYHTNNSIYEQEYNIAKIKNNIVYIDKINFNDDIYYDLQLTNIKGNYSKPTIIIPQIITDDYLTILKRKIKEYYEMLNYQKSS